MDNNISKIHPELQLLAKRIPAIHYNAKNIHLFRFLLSLMSARNQSANVQIENKYTPGDEDQPKVRVRIYRSRAAAERVPLLIWLHGGGYIMGRPEMDDRLCAQYVNELGITIISVDYRCAPEHPFPAALQDGYAAFVWAVSNARQLGIDEERIAIGGASAGGGLAAALVQYACDLGPVKPVFQLLVYPMLDDRTALRTDIDDGNSLPWSQKSNRFGWEAYTGQSCGSDSIPPYAVPARRDDLSGLPPAWIGAGTLDVFYEEDIAYGSRLRQCGVGCDLYQIPGAFHGFDQFDPNISIIREFRRTQMEALKQNLFPGAYPKKGLTLGDC